MICSVRSKTELLVTNLACKDDNNRCVQLDGFEFVAFINGDDNDLKLCSVGFIAKQMSSSKLFFLTIMTNSPYISEVNETNDTLYSLQEPSDEIESELQSLMKDSIVCVYQLGAGSDSNQQALIVQTSNSIYLLQDGQKMKDLNKSD